MAHITWNEKNTGEKAQFVCDILKESLFDYASDSNKIPTLNLHYFCLDYISTYLLIEDGTMNIGNIQPLNEEFEYIVNTSLWIPNCISSSIFLFLDSMGKARNISKEKNIDLKKRSEYYYECVRFIKGMLESDDDYISKLLNEIHQTLYCKQFTINERHILYFCVREYICELINIGISKSHLYNQVQKKLFSKFTPEDDLQYVEQFLNSLIPEEQNYDIVFGVSEDVYNELSTIIKGFREATEDESKKLNSKYVMETSLDSKDPVSALSYAKKLLLSILSVYNSCIHNENMDIIENGLVKINDGSNSDTKYTFIKDSKKTLAKTRNKDKDSREKWLIEAVKRNIDNRVIGSFELHNNAINMSDCRTQLLTLWTIFEILIETKQKDMSRINYITNVLVSMLCNIYYKGIIESIYYQIKNTKYIKTTIEKETRGDNRAEKLAFILKDNTNLKNKILKLIDSYPLEKYRIERLSEIFSSASKMKLDFLRHANRVRWQIMRIYRNRCMIVHSGEYFPYIELILENLHYYVDEIYNYIFDKADLGINEIEVIFSLARINYQQNMELLSVKDKVLSDDEFVKIIFHS